MNIRLHPHAEQRAVERGTDESEIRQTVMQGERFNARFSRTGFRRNFAYNAMWRGKAYGTKQIEAIAVEVPEGRLVITVDGEILLT